MLRVELDIDQTNPLAVHWTPGQSGLVDLHDFFAFQDLEIFISGTYYDKSHGKIEDLPLPVTYSSFYTEYETTCCNNSKKLLSLMHVNDKLYSLYIDTYNYLTVE